MTQTDTQPLFPDAIDRKQPFKLCAAMHQPPMLEDGQPERSTFRSAVANRLYITRDRGEDIFGSVDFTHKAGDLVRGERRGPDGCNAPGIAGIELWRRADAAAAADRPELAAAFHAIGWLPREVDEPTWKNMLQRFIDEQLVQNGMITDWAIHRRRNADGSWSIMPHAHLIITSRGWRAKRSPGRRNLAWFGSRRTVQAAEDAWNHLLSEATP